MEANEYYRYRYPYDALVALLTCNGDDLSCLEFALEGEVYKRYVSVTSPNELKVAPRTIFPGFGRSTLAPSTSAGRRGTCATTRPGAACSPSTST